MVTEFAVDGANLPNVGFDVGESYAGSLPIGDANPGAELFYWFFPSTSEEAQTNKEILLWVTGGVSDHPSPNLHPTPPSETNQEQTKHSPAVPQSANSSKKTGPSSGSPAPSRP